GPNIASTLIAVQCEREGRKFIRPELSLKSFTEVRCFRALLISHIVKAEIRRCRRNAESSCINVRLDLTECDRALCQCPVTVKYRVLGILPPLLKQSSGGLPSVLDKAVTIDVAVKVDPVKCGQDVVPNRPDEFLVARPFIVGAGQHRKKRGGINAAVVIS